MGRVTTNSTALSVTTEATPGVLPGGTPVWDQLEPNSIGAFGVSISKGERSPISQARQRRKGVVTDADATVEFDADLTLSHLRRFMQGFAFAQAVGADVFTPSAATSGGYTVPAVTAAQAGRLLYGASSATSLIYARGFPTAANNGIAPLSGAVATSAVLIPVAGNVAETPGATLDVEVAVCGVRGAAGDLEIDSDGNLISTVLNFTALGLTAGQFIHIGGIDAANQFFVEANLGFARVVSIAANKLTLDKKATTFATDDGTVDNDGGDGVRVDILFGQFVRNVDVDHADYLETTFQFELESPNLGTGGADQYEYGTGMYGDALSIELPLVEKASVSYGFVGIDVTRPSGTRATGAVNARSPSSTGAFATASDLARLRMQDVDEAGLSTDFKSITLTLTNNVSPEKVLGTLGAKYLNAGNIEVDVEAQMLFTNPDLVERIRCNKTVGLDFALHNDDGGAYFDFPSGTLGGGDREYPVNESVLINTTLMTHRDPLFGTSFSVSFFPVLPARECA
jgi:hypothetical protein